ncbi:MAG: MFS transporter [Gammaproteobacteria bacterium]
MTWRYRPWVMVWPLAISQLISWGCIYYAFAVFIVPLETEFGWSKRAINFALTLALLVLAVATYPVARWLDHHGGRIPMTIAPLVAGLALFTLSQLDSYLAFIALWLVLGICMSALLYEPALAVISQVFGKHARSGITALTLVAGFSSTVYIPLSEYAVAELGWRDTYVLLAAMMVLLVFPLHLLFVPPRVVTDRRGVSRNPSDFKLSGLIRNPLFWGLTAWASTHAFVLVGLFFQLVPWLKSEGVETRVIVIAVATMGPMQVLGRLIAFVFARNLSLKFLGLFTTMAFPVAVSLLFYGGKTIVMLVSAMALFGMANGITTILRGAIPAEWFAAEHYAKVAGAIATPAITIGAVAPFVLAFVWETVGLNAMTVVTVIASVVSFLSFGFAACSTNRARSG